MKPITDFSDFHMHSTYSDGAATIQEMARSAIEKGLTTIAITDHMPLPFRTRYAMDKDRLLAYRNEIDKVRQRHGHQLTILTGLEIEYLPDILGWIEDILAFDWDLLIASVHHLPGGDSHAMVNGNETEFKNTLTTVFNNDIKALCRQYYQTIQQAAATHWFDIIGHLDVLKKHNRANQYFDEKSPWYKALVEETLDVLKIQSIKMEINTSGRIHPANAFYPSPWIIKAAMDRGIPLTMGSDSHAPNTLGQFFDLAQGLIRN